jgi:ATP-binding protein involved in chromosome partitioning
LAEQNVVPASIRREADAVTITWSEPGHVGRFAARGLRLACPCAVCVDELTNRPLLDPETVPRDVAPQAIELVGAYGIRIRWSDGHGTGIYTFRMLRERCPCGGCAG